MASLSKAFSWARCLIVNKPEIPYSIFVSLIFAVPIMMELGLAGVRLWVGVTPIPKGIVETVVARKCILGTHAVANDIFTVRITAFFGVVGYLLRKVKINPAPIVLAMVLVYMMESNFRRGMLTSGDDPSFFITRPISAVLLAAAVFVLMLPFFQKSFRKQWQGALTER